MNSRFQMRMKLEENKRKCLLKKTNFNEYLNSYQNTEESNSYQEINKNKTSFLFFPCI